MVVMVLLALSSRLQPGELTYATRMCDKSPYIQENSFARSILAKVSSTSETWARVRPAAPSVFAILKFHLDR
jgi:hypothetical protein